MPYQPDDHPMRLLKLYRQLGERRLIEGKEGASPVGSCDVRNFLFSFGSFVNRGCQLDEHLPSSPAKCLLSQIARVHKFPLPRAAPLTEGGHQTSRKRGSHSSVVLTCLGFFEHPDNPQRPRQAAGASRKTDRVFKYKAVNVFTLSSVNVRLDPILATSQPVPTGRSAQPIYDDLRQTHPPLARRHTADLSARSASHGFPHASPTGPGPKGHGAFDPFGASTSHTLSNTSYYVELINQLRPRSVFRFRLESSTPTVMAYRTGCISTPRFTAHSSPCSIRRVTQSTWHDGSTATPDYQQQSPRDNVIAQSHH
ncbi:hypothetical protein BDP81DRAFT_475135 [Colletotrichum phormii]|uniref:Uncharacterized protein n=1 Tax=Colletotrichum phormii TaxID=359342 RepID=A0AAJ0EAQ9_9PEZI|nr:uncharacterized protein BDP81DRAFT_475135 [Colletotrichum phormii]KAK1624210.1 hypothetical protein BDP81DRAFT_475135 [Colletotrichum phormii]